VLTRAHAGDVLGLLGDPWIAEDTWVEVPAGAFLMGTTPKEVAELVRRYGKGSEDFFKREAPQHRLELDPFPIGKYQVTNREFKRTSRTSASESGVWWCRTPLSLGSCLLSSVC
jgi:formylglycine-generating enzyme required for sulfatase activity